MVPGPFGPGAGARRGVPAEPLKGGETKTAEPLFFCAPSLKGRGAPCNNNEC